MLMKVAPCLIYLYFVLAHYMVGSMYPFSTYPGGNGDTFVPTIIADNCFFGSTNVVTNPFHLSKETIPKCSSCNSTYFLWKSYGKKRPAVTLKICEYGSIISVSFYTSNVRSSGIIVDSTSYYGEVDGYKKVEVAVGSGYMSNSNAGTTVKIAITPLNYSLPVEIKNLEINYCTQYYDCFDDCALYLVDSFTGCKSPMCRGDPCEYLSCTEDQECRLIENVDERTFPSVMTPGVQLWDCVNKDRTDYGCKCKKYGVGDNQCPTCNCSSV